MRSLAITRKIRFVVPLLFLLATFFSSNVTAKEGIGILLLNSDYGVEKYARAQTEFEAIVKHQFTSIDLHGRWFDKTIIENTILDDSPEVIYCIGMRAFKLAYQLAERRNQIVFSSIINWQRLPKRENTYGIANELSSAMELMTYLYLFPDIRKIGILYSTRHNHEWLQTAIKSAREVNVTIVPKTVNNPAALRGALLDILPEIDALWLISDPIVISGKKAVLEIFSQCDAKKKPVFAYDEVFVNFGALMIISPDISTIGRQAASLARDLLKNKPISDPVAVAAGSEITVNIRQVDKYGININTEALNSVNNIIR